MVIVPGERTQPGRQDHACSERIHVRVTPGRVAEGNAPCSIDASKVRANRQATRSIGRAGPKNTGNSLPVDMFTEQKKIATIPKGAFRTLLGYGAWA
jgi:hypothetical protein